MHITMNETNLHISQNLTPMNTLERVVIEGLWGDSRPLVLSFDRRFNFIIGQNGTGKTTVINLLAAVLTPDFERLDRIPFSRVTITLRQEKKRRKPILEVIKTRKAGTQFNDITYAFRSSAKTPPIVVNLDAMEPEHIPRGVPLRAVRERFYRERFADVQERLRELVAISWLSVHRHNEDFRSPEERRNIPAIDQKMTALNNELVRYFSQLSKRYTDHTVEFQKKSLLSVLTTHKADRVTAFGLGLDIEGEKKSLAEMFEVLGVEKKNYTQKINAHFEKLSDAIEKFKQPEKPIHVDDFAALYDGWRSHSLVQEYEELQQTRDEIFRPRDNFLMVLNGLLGGRKRITVSEKNEVVVETGKGKPIRLEDLSSGEKQLLIILGEALLQESSPVVYIADEPELSLHVYWQEQLTAAISQLNPNVQIVFATHSPDIVNVHDDKIIDMEKLVA